MKITPLFAMFSVGIFSSLGRAATLATTPPNPAVSEQTANRDSQTAIIDNRSEPTTKQIIDNEFPFVAKYPPRAKSPSSDEEQLLASAIPARREDSSRIAFSTTPSSAFCYDGHYRALWFPSVSLRF